jgi:hypothetical protein
MDILVNPIAKPVLAPSLLKEATVPGAGYGLLG